jgi:hypothetical protein
VTFFWLTAVAVLVTKFADLWTTWRFVGAEAETNPIGRFLFRRIGVLPGLVLVGVVVLAVVAVTYGGAAASGSVVAQVLVATYGGFVSVVQAAVAHHNATGRANAVTRVVMNAHRRIARF